MFNSLSELTVNKKYVCVVPEIDEYAFYLMQWLQIGTESFLVFYDWGANAHVGDSRMAMKLKLKLYQQNLLPWQLREGLW